MIKERKMHKCSFLGPRTHYSVVTMIFCFDLFSGLLFEKLGLWLRSLEQFIETQKVQINFWNRILFTRYWRFLNPHILEQLKCQFGTNNSDVETYRNKLEHISVLSFLGFISRKLQFMQFDIHYNSYFAFKTNFTLF